MPDDEEFNEEHDDVGEDDEYEAWKDEELERKINAGEIQVQRLDIVEALRILFPSLDLDDRNPFGAGRPKGLSKRTKEIVKRMDEILAKQKRRNISAAARKLVAEKRFKDLNDPDYVRKKYHKTKASRRRRG